MCNGSGLLLTPRTVLVTCASATLATMSGMPRYQEITTNATTWMAPDLQVMHMWRFLSGLGVAFHNLLLRWSPTSVVLRIMKFHRRYMCRLLRIIKLQQLLGIFGLLPC